MECGETKVYDIVGKTKNGLYIGQDINGIKECFSEYDLGKIEKQKIRDMELGAGKYR